MSAERSRDAVLDASGVLDAQLDQAKLPKINIAASRTLLPERILRYD
jgi:hypothetical protein